MSNKATFFLSTGRCGTQWLAKQLEAVYGDLATVRHEPIFLHYWPRQMLGHGDPGRLPDATRLLDHLSRLGSSLDLKPYIECGWPNYGAIPHLMQRFDGRVRIVHLTRHPLETARSLLSHRWYQRPPLVKEIAEQGELTPFDPGVRFPDYGERWPMLSAYEKSLYFWSEVNALGLDLQEQARCPWLRLSFEDLFTGDGLERLLTFLELPQRQEIFDQRTSRYDKVPAARAPAPDRALAESHPVMIELAARLGYDLNAEDDGQPIAVPASRNAPCPCGSGLRYKHCHGRLS